MGDQQQKSPTGVGSALEHLKHLEVPGQGHLGEVRGRPESIGGSGMRGRNEDFAAGYSLGLIGGVRSWVSPTFFLLSLLLLSSPPPLLLALAGTYTPLCPCGQNVYKPATKKPC
jgi:hypothetical protein